MTSTSFHGVVAAPSYKATIMPEEMRGRGFSYMAVFKWFYEREVRNRLAEHPEDC